jgi:DNA-directed RNA polymerase specialized sigma24 family protein
MMNLKVGLGSVHDVDDVVRDALERAFRANI